MKPLALARRAFAAVGFVCLMLGMLTVRSIASDSADDGSVAGPGAAQAEEKKATDYKGQTGYQGGVYPYGDDRSNLPDSFKYYGPNGLWKTWDEEQKIGRNTWIVYNAGNQKFYRILARFGGSHGISIDFFRLLATPRDKRFHALGLINEPNFGDAEPDPTYGFLMQPWKGDPEGTYEEDIKKVLDGKYESAPAPGAKKGAYPRNARWYGEPTGIVGLRRFDNPDFTQAMKDAWLKDPASSMRTYFKSPGTVEPPYLFGISCALCHMAFDPLNPPKDPVNPRWENMAANMGNQYFREGDMFFGAGRVVGGNANPGPSYNNGDGDPYDTKGLDETSFLYQYAHTQQPGTSETSRFSYDFINNPNTINQIINIGARAKFTEKASTGGSFITNHILKDGADSVGIETALLRVFINVGAEGDYWADHLWNPATGVPQSPFQIKEVRNNVAPGRWTELRKKYPELGEAWKESESRVNFLIKYLASYTPYALVGRKDSKGKSYVSEDVAQLRRGAELYVRNCIACHSNDQPNTQYVAAVDADKLPYFRQSVAAPSFPGGNTLSDDVRYPFNYPGFGINAARALATNAIEQDIWADFSSEDYKQLPPIRTVKFVNPLNKLDPARYGDTPIVTEFTVPGGGRGYYRTAALNSMWATAPFLHNNSVGKEAVDAAGRVDKKYLTIEGRLELFESAIQELLSPDNERPLKIKVTSADCSLIAGMPEIGNQLASMLRNIAKERFAEIFRETVSEAVDELPFSPVDAPLKPLVKKVAADLLDGLQPEIDKLFTDENLKKINEQVVAAVHQKVQQAIESKFQGRPRLAQLASELKPKFQAAIDRKIKQLPDLFQAQLAIPKGTPLNLILNLNASRAPYALKGYLKNKGNQRLAAEELLKLSDCPDLVENKGHTFGSELSPREKRDLIEFLKTL
jgi:hypothetical protein